MREEDITLYINCRSDIIKDLIYEKFMELLEKMNIKHKDFKYYKVIEIQLEEHFLFYTRILDMTKDNFVKSPKYSMNDVDVVEILNNKDLNDKEKFKNIFGDFIVGEF